MSRVSIEIDEKNLKTLIYDYLQDKLGSIPLNEEDVEILVKSKQNYRSEWEKANFKASVSVYI